MATREAVHSVRTSQIRSVEPSAPGLGIAAAIFFGLSMVYFIPAFLPGRHIFGTDYLAGGYFFYEFVSQRLAAGELPKWVPYIYGGLPLYSNPGSTFYPVRLFADLLMPVTWILPFIFVVQFTVAGIGMYLLARELGCRAWVAMVTGLTFQFTGITLSAVYAGHDGRVIVATFAPLFFFFLHRGLRTGAIGAFVGAAATIGFGLLSFQIQSNYYLLLASAIWVVFCIVHLRLAGEPKQLARRVALGLAAVAFGFSLAAVNFLPFLDYVPESPRGAEGGRGYDYSVSWSMPPLELISVAVPEHAGILDNYEGVNPFKLHTEYAGALVVVLFALGFHFSRRNRYWWFFLGLALFSLTIAFGGHTPLYRLYYAVLPGTQRFRAPSISFFLVTLSLVSMAAITLERMAAQRDETGVSGSRRKAGAGPADPLLRWLGTVVGFAVLAVIVATVAAGSEPRDAAMVAGFGRFAVFATLICGAIWLWWSHRVRSFAFAALIGMVTVVDLWIVNRTFFETVDPPGAMFAPDDVVRFLESQPQPARSWVLPFPPGGAYRGHGNYLMLYRLEQAGGEHGNQLQRFNEFAGAGEDVYVDWANFLEAPNFLHAGNIRFIVSMVELETPFLREVHRGSALIYENLEARPRAYLAEQVVATSDPAGALALLRSPDFDVARTAVIYGTLDPAVVDSPLQGIAEVIEDQPDRVVVRTRADRPALLVLADNHLHGWRARVNGADAPILLTNHTFRGVVVGEGESEVVFEFRPEELYLGFYIYLAGLLLLTGYGVWSSISWVRRRGEVEV